MSNRRVKGVRFLKAQHYRFTIRNRLPGKGQRDLKFDFYQKCRKKPKEVLRDRRARP